MWEFDEAVEVRANLVDGAPVPDQFLWRGRLWRVCSIRARWVETAIWWERGVIGAGVGAADARLHSAAEASVDSARRRDAWLGTNGSTAPTALRPDLTGHDSQLDPTPSDSYRPAAGPEAPLAAPSDNRPGTPAPEPWHSATEGRSSASGAESRRGAVGPEGRLGSGGSESRRSSVGPEGRLAAGCSGESGPSRFRPAVASCTMTPAGSANVHAGGARASESPAAVGVLDADWGPNRTVYRVEAGCGRHSRRELFDLAHDPDSGRWQLERVIDR